MSAPKPVLVLGDIAAEVLLSGLSGHPRKGQEVYVTHAEMTAGGAGAGVACGLARLGRKLTLRGAVGRDAAGEMVLEALNQRHVDVRSVKKDPKAGTAIAVSLSEPEGRSIVAFPGAAASLRGRDLRTGPLTNYAHVHVASPFLFPGLSGEIAALLKKAQAAKVTTSLSPGWDPRGRWSLEPMYKYLNLLLAGEPEAKALTGTGNPAMAAKRLAERVPLAVVRRGEQGAVAATHSGMWKASEAGVEAVDSAGTESTFDAAFLDGWLDGHRIQEILIYACAAARWCRERRGGIEAQPTRTEALHRIGGFANRENR